MSKTIRFQVALAATIFLAGAVGFAQSGEATYKAKCQMCHGVKGMADSPAGKAMKVKPITDPEVKKFTEAQMIEAVRNGMGKMQPYKGKLTDAQIKEAVEHFRTFSK
jgi:mono/diheme cytochrome c family protein